jgi:hypothetical protein
MVATKRVWSAQDVKHSVALMLVGSGGKLRQSPKLTR